MAEQKTQRAFRRPEDLYRMLEQLAKSSQGFAGADPIEKAMFLSRVDPVPAVYSYLWPIVAGDLTKDYLAWQYWRNPSNFLPTTKPGFWKSPMSAENVDTAALDELNGWLFWPDDITVEFYTSAMVVRSARILRLRTNAAGLDTSVVYPHATTDSYMLLGIASNANYQYHQSFCARGPGSYDGNGANVGGLGGWLRKVGLPPFSSILFTGLQGLVATDYVRLMVSGRYRFSPYFMEAGEFLNQ